MADGGDHDSFPARGQVSKVCDAWRVFEDGAMAHNMQEDEFGQKYDRNRFHRKTARIDVPTAKVVHSAEEERLQREAMERLQEQNRQAEHDARVAAEVYRQLIRDEQAQKMSRVQEDEEIARKLQEKEQQKYERKQRERELAKERKKLSVLAAQKSAEVLQEYKLETAHEDVNQSMESMYINTEPEKLLRQDGKVEDLGDFSDFYIQPEGNMDPRQQEELRRIQDEELARLLQEQEHKRGASLNRDKLKAIEAQDEELARVIQEQEKIRAKKCRDKRADRQKSVPAPHRQFSNDVHGHEPVRSRSVGSPHYHPNHNSHHDDDHIYENAGGQPPNVPPRNSEGRGGGFSDNYQNTVLENQSRYDDTYLPPLRTSHRPFSESPDQLRQYERESRQLSEGSNSPTPSGEVHRNHSVGDGPLHRSPSSDQHLTAPLPASNVIASIDPTVRSTDHSPVHTIRSQASPPHTITRTPPTAGEEPYATWNQQEQTGPGTLHAPSSNAPREPDGYCDLDDVPNFAPVQGQKRNKKGSRKDKNCKQQ